MSKTWQAKHSMTSFNPMHPSGDHSKFVRHPSSHSLGSLPSSSVLEECHGHWWAGPATAFGVLCPAGSTSLLTSPDTNTPRQEPLAEVRAENIVKLKGKCLGGSYFFHTLVTSTVSYTTSLEIH